MLVGWKPGIEIGKEGCVVSERRFAGEGLSSHILLTL
jgi:hypothetical protein